MVAPVLRPAKSSPLALVGLGLLAAFVFHALALDQGQLLSLVQGEAAYVQNFIHELTHDARHAAGFPCH